MYFEHSEHISSQLADWLSQDFSANKSSTLFMCGSNRENQLVINDGETVVDCIVASLWWNESRNLTLKRMAPRVFGQSEANAVSVPATKLGEPHGKALQAGSCYFRGSPQGGTYLHTRALEYIRLRPALNGRLSKSTRISRHNGQSTLLRPSMAHGPSLPILQRIASEMAANYTAMDTRESAQERAGMGHGGDVAGVCVQEVRREWHAYPKFARTSARGVVEEARH